ncbi:MAG: hypothetical protein U0270_18560 [Labilithrix sp.]
MSVDHKLYVGNLADDITATALRQRFEQVGRVADVELGIDRASGRMRGFAFVTMADRDAYRAAISQLNGATFEDRVLRVCEAGEERNNDEGGGRRSKKDAPVRRAKITSQFRERTCMAIELDCEGTKLAFKMYPTQVEGSTDVWRVDASSPTRSPDPQVQANAPTRREAFAQIERTWGASSLDWRAIEEALVSVRAI